VSKIIDSISVAVGAIYIIVGIGLALIAMTNIPGKILILLMALASGLSYICPPKYYKNNILKVLLILILVGNFCIFSNWLIEGSRGDGGFIIALILLLMILKPFNLICILMKSFSGTKL